MPDDELEDADELGPVGLWQGAQELRLRVRYQCVEVLQVAAPLGGEGDGVAAAVGRVGGISASRWNGSASWPEMGLAQAGVPIAREGVRAALDYLG